MTPFPKAGARRAGREIHSWFGRLFEVIPYLLAVAVLFLMGWAALVILQHPYSGLSWSYTDGEVQAVDPLGPGAGVFQVGDRIQSIDGKPPYEARGLPGRRAGERVTFIVERDGQISPIDLELARPGLPRVFSELSTLPVAFSFWLLGLLVLILGPPGGLTRLFFLFSQVFTLILALGSISSFGPLWSSWAFVFLQWWIGPLALHTHLLLANRRSSRFQARLVWLVYLLALIFSLLDMLRLISGTPGLLITARYVWVGCTLLGAAGALLFADGRHPEEADRRKTRIAGLAALIAFLPFVLLSLTPDAIFDRYLLPYEITFLALPVLPLGYSYAILQHRLIQLERFVNRGAAYTLVFLLIAGLYGLIYLASRFIWDKSTILLEFGFGLALILAVQPLYRVTQHWVDRIFYGDSYDDRTAYEQISLALTGAAGDLDAIALALCQTLQKVLQLEYANLLLAGGRLVSSQLEIAVSVETIPIEQERVISTWLQSIVLTTRREVGPVSELEQIPGFPERWKQQAFGPKPRLWLMLAANETPRGLLILGPRRGNGALSARDLDILEGIIHQTSLALENAILLNEVRLQIEHNRALQRQVFQAREDERMRLARDLHDCTIQALSGANYQLAELRALVDPGVASKIPPVMETLRQASQDLRKICAGLRPSALDALGLVPALQARVAELTADASFEVQLDLDDALSHFELAEESALCVYRLVHEGLQNVHKHAAPDNVLVSIHVEPENELIVVVDDDGRGFAPPHDFRQLAEMRRFGLIGLREQVEALGGRLELRSAPGKGCRLSAWIPLAKEERSQ